jgi:hypothetical protein
MGSYFSRQPEPVERGEKERRERRKEGRKKERKKDSSSTS